MPLLVLMNAFFVAAEFALVAVRRSRVDEMVNQRRAGSGAVKHAIEHLDDAIAATQLGITLASLALGWVGEPSVARLLEPLFGFLPRTARWVAAHTVATIVAFALITFLHVILGELAPKAVALQRPDTVSLWVARPLLWFSRRDAPVHRRDERDWATASCDCWASSRSAAARWSTRWRSCA